jgi:hypothetical protein
MRWAGPAVIPGAVVPPPTTLTRVQVIRELRELLGLRDFRKLFAVRLVSQAGDGMFEVGLATLFFFSPENASTATGVAEAFAVLLLPFTVVGPWAGVLLDRSRLRSAVRPRRLALPAVKYCSSATLRGLRPRSPSR